MRQIYTKEQIEELIEYHGEKDRERIEKGFVTMTVKEVIKKLSTFPEDMPVVLVGGGVIVSFHEDSFTMNYSKENRGFICDILEIG